MNRLLLILTIIISGAGCSVSQKSRVLFVNSYHEGYPISDQVMEGAKDELQGKKVDLEFFFLNSKINPENDSIIERSTEAYIFAKQFDPEVIILSDDNAVKFFGKVYYDSLNVPFVFCGVNWDHRAYTLPPDQFTGILEVLPVRECVDILRKSNPDAKKLGILSENTNSEKKNQIYLNTITAMENEYRLVDNFTQWKSNFLELSRSCDFIFIPTNGGIRNWNDDEAIAFIKENIKVPIFTCDEFMMKYADFGMTKIPREPGEWAARTTLLLLKGKNVEDIPVAKNSQFQTWVNPDIARATGFDPSILANYKIYPQGK